MNSNNVLIVQNIKRGIPWIQQDVLQKNVINMKLLQEMACVKHVVPIWSVIKL